MKNLEKNIPANKKWEIRKKEILNQLNNRQETLEIKTENFRYFEKQNGRFKFDFLGNAPWNFSAPTFRIFEFTFKEKFLSANEPSQNK